VTIRQKKRILSVLQETRGSLGEIMNIGKLKNLALLRIIASFASILAMGLVLTSSFAVASSISITLTFIFTMTRRNVERKRERALLVAVPEIIDHIISGTQSGLSLSESLSSLNQRGPEISREIFGNFEESLREGQRFEEAVGEVQKQFSLRSADQLFEALLFARVLGGSELVNLLRELGNFTREDLALRREIEAKQGWIRNSAHLSASAPWLLLLLLSMQPATASAYATPSGILVLSLGMILTAIAYLWMGYLGRIPQPPRIFGSQ
jgi:tight adherence protein B